MTQSQLRKVVTGASIGNAVEWFDFAIYGFLATFIAANFFPSGDDTAGDGVSPPASIRPTRNATDVLSARVTMVKRFDMNYRVSRSAIRRLLSLLARATPATDNSPEPTAVSGPRLISPL